MSATEGFLARTALLVQHAEVNTALRKRNFTTESMRTANPGCANFANQLYVFCRKCCQLRPHETGGGKVGHSGNCRQDLRVILTMFVFTPQ